MPSKCCNRDKVLVQGSYLGVSQYTHTHTPVAFHLLNTPDTTVGRCKTGFAGARSGRFRFPSSASTLSSGPVRAHFPPPWRGRADEARPAALLRRDPTSPRATATCYTIALLSPKKLASWVRRARVRVVAAGGGLYVMSVMSTFRTTAHLFPMGIPLRAW